MGASALSAIASLVFSIFFIVGAIALFSSQPPGPSEILPGVQIATIRILGGCAALFGMFGLLIARALVVLIEIEKSSRRAPSLQNVSEVMVDSEPTAAFKVGRAVGKVFGPNN